MCPSLSAHTDCKSLTKARKSPGFPSMRASRASGSMLLLSASRTLCATRLRCSFPTRLKLINSVFIRSLSLFLFQLLPRPHSLIGLLHVMMMGCWVRFSRFSNSAFPPESPFSTGPSSSGRIALSTLSSEILANPPLRWSTSSSRITVFPLVTPPPENWSREMC